VILAAIAIPTGHLRNAFGPDVLSWPIGLLLFVIGAATLEGLVRSFVLRRAYDWRAYAASMGDALGRRAVDALGLSIAAPAMAWAHDHRVQTIALLFVDLMAAAGWRARLRTVLGPPPTQREGP